MNLPAKYETYVVAQPWIILNYLMSDAEADAAGGQSMVRLECCICGQRKVEYFRVPRPDDSVWATLDSRKGLPETNALLHAFQLAHLHEDKQADPMRDWVRPLRNVAALSKGVDLAALAERLTRELSEEGKS